MSEALLVVIAVLSAVSVFLLWRLSSHSPLEGAREQWSKMLADNERALREELRLSREESSRASHQLRTEVVQSLKSSADTLAKTLNEQGTLQKNLLEGVARQLKELTDKNEQRLERLRQTTEVQIKSMQESNEKKLDEMRKTVDEKLQGTLEKRLGDSFKLVSERLEAVQRGLGEMQSLATGVGDLKRVLTNVKTRGTFGEFQLGAILEQVLTADQFGRNVAVREGSRDMVEFAVRLPGPDPAEGRCIWLPIDSKFPQEDYLRLVEAADRGDADAVGAASQALARAVRTAAQDIHAKYVCPPATTDFALMFVPTEGLYSEILRQPDLVQDLLNQQRVVVTGPATLAAILSSLRMGFRTLAIEQRASEVWTILGAVKTEFGKFGDVLEKVQKQLNTASRTLEDTGARTRAMERKLREVEQLPSGDAARLLEIDAEPVQPFEPQEPQEPQESLDLPEDLQ